MNNEINIPYSIFEGYLWVSSEKEPIIINSQEFSLSGKGFHITTEGKELELEESQFIIEGLLFDTKNSISYSIQSINGLHQVTQRHVADTDFNLSNVRLVEYKGNHKDLPYLQFLQYWKPTPDRLCENMDVMVPEAMVFVGFNHKED